MTQTNRVVAADDSIERLARAGYLTKGFVYALVGMLATQAAMGSGGATTDTEGALRQIVTEPFGQVLLALIALGLVGYAIWCVAQATLDLDGKGDDVKGAAQRIGALGSGLIYGGLALTAARLAIGASSGGSGGGPEDITAMLMGWPLGVWLVGIGGALVIGFGLYEFYAASRATFRERLKLAEMSAGEQTWAVRAGRFGLAARGVVFGMIGVFLIRAAITANPEQAQGLGEALATLARQPYGPWLLGIVALGLVSYGIYQAVLARYRRVRAR